MADDINSLNFDSIIRINDKTSARRTVLSDSNGNGINPSSQEKQSELNTLIQTLTSTVNQLGLLINDHLIPFLKPYARNVNDSIRANVESGAINTTSYMWNVSTYSNYYTTGGVNSVDGREQLKEINNLTFQQTLSRWTFS